MKKIAIIVTIGLITISLAGAGWMLANSSQDSDKPAKSASKTSDKRKETPLVLAGTKLENFETVEEVNDLQITDTKSGDGDEAKSGGDVIVHYTGAVAATGIIFQSSKDSGRPATLNLNGVIEGWKQGIPGMKVGGVRRLVIPADMAYGATPPPGSGIPPNAALVFDVELVAVDPVEVQ